MMALKNLSRSARTSQLLMNHPRTTGALAMGVVNQHGLAKRNYFSFVDKMRDRFNKPWRHVQSFMEPDGINYQTQLPEGYRTHGNTAASFSAYITQNSLELNQWHEMESVVHS